MVDGMTIAAKVWGSEGGIPVLAMHGWLDNAATFDRLGPHLAKAGIHAVCIDHTGHGRSSHRSADAVYTFADHAFYAMEVVRALGWQRFSVMGHSMGAAVASAIAGSYTDVVECAVYIEALGVITRPVAATAAHLREAIKQRASLTQLRSRGIARVYPNFDAAVKARLKTLERLPGSQTLEESSARLLVKRGLIACGDAAIDDEVSDDYNGPVKFRHDQRLLGPSPVYMTEEQAIAFLSASTCPVLAVGGHNGWPWSTSTMTERAAILGDRMQVVRVPGSHHCHLDESTYRGVIDPVVAFLTQPHTTVPSSEDAQSTQSTREEEG